MNYELKFHSGPITVEKERHRSVTACPRSPGLTSCLVSPGTRDFVACNHLRSYKYYLESILNPDGFAAYPCASYRDFESVSYYSAMNEEHHTRRSYWVGFHRAFFLHATPSEHTHRWTTQKRMIREQITLIGAWDASCRRVHWNLAWREKKINRD